MFGEIVTGVLTEVVIDTGRRVGGALTGPRERPYRDEIEIAAWFNTYRLTEESPDITLPEGVTEESVAQFLAADACHAILHELLAARLCDAPESDIGMLRAAFRRGSEVGEFSGALFDYYDSEICTLVGKLEGGLPDMLPKLREGAVAARIVASLHAIERHCAALAADSDPLADADFLVGYRRHVVEHHGMLEPPDFERRRRVPIADLYVAPDIVPLAQDVYSSALGIPIDVFAGTIDRTVLLGSPGAGKTTASHVLMHFYAQNPGRRTPFLVTLREFASQDGSVLTHIENRLDSFYQRTPPSGLVRRLLLNGSALVIFDGLDELLDTSRRREMTAVIERFATEYPNARILVTSRIVGYDQARLDDRQFAGYRIGDFDEKRVTEYAGKWFAQELGLAPGEAEQWTEAFVSESASVPDLRVNPLMLSLMCVLYRGERSIPSNRSEVYEKCANLLFRRWDAQRDIQVRLRASHLVEPTLRHLAYWLFTREETQTAVTERRLVRETAEFLHRRGIETLEEATEAAEEFVAFCCGRAWVFSDAGTTAAGDKLFTFTHRTFLEYFTAQYLAVTHDTPEGLAETIAPRIADEQWEIVAEIAIQLKERSSDCGAERIFSWLLFDRRKRSGLERGNILTFLARCLRAVDLPPALVRELTRRALDHVLADGAAERRITAVPLGTLLTSCWRSREVVREEVERRVDFLIESGDQAARQNGLRLAVSCDHGEFADSQLIFDEEIHDFWASVVERYVAAYRDDVLAASATDPGFADLAWRHDLLSFEQLLAQSGLEGVFSASSLGFFIGMSFSPVMLSAVGGVLGLPGWSTPQSRADCAALGRYLIDSWETPPWQLGRVAWNKDLITVPTARAEIQGNEYLGAAIGLLIFAEHLIEAEPGVEVGLDALGPLHELRPYIRWRLGGALERAWPKLPVPGHIQKAIEDWADRKINFDVSSMRYSH